MQLIRRLHLYLGCLFAPALIFFAVTGSWQLYRLHESTKGGYRAPVALEALSAIHKDAHLLGKRASVYTPLVCLAGGIIIPCAILYIYR